jgi:dihydropteroate synthase
MDDLQVYDDVVTDVRDELAARMAALHDDGVRPEQVILDPGLGFAKAGVLNWPLLAHLDALHQLGRPVLVGASRKRFLGHLLADPSGRPASPRGRDDATAAISALSAASGAWCVRVHTVRASADAVKVAAAWSDAADGSQVGSPGSTFPRTAPEALTSTVALTTESWTAGGQGISTWQDSGARTDDGGRPR